VDSVADNNLDLICIDESQLVELKEIDVSADPVRPELNLKWRNSFGRKIFGLERGNQIEAVVCLAFTNEVPRSVRDLDLMSRTGLDANIAIAYTVWSLQKGAGKEIMREVLAYAQTNGFERVVTLSPLTPMATRYHTRNGAKLISLNDSTQNFEYDLKN
jgi:hypothetical protein